MTLITISCRLTQLICFTLPVYFISVVVLIDVPVRKFQRNQITVVARNKVIADHNRNLAVGRLSSVGVVLKFH